MTDAEILDAILLREGGYVDHPLDRGGPTNMGITLATLGKWRGKPVTAADVKALGHEEAAAIYYAWYVAPFADVARDLKPLAVDIAVMSGATTARGLLARANGDRVALVKERLRQLARIVKGRPTQAVFLEGWINRTLEFL